MKIVPVLKKEKFEDAKEILDKEKINYKEEKEFSLFIRRGRVIRTEPEEGSEIKNSDEVTVYVSKLWLFPFLLFFIVLILLMFINIGISSIITNNRPLIESKEDGWVKSNIVYVKKDVDVSELESYMYCVTENKSSKKCDWKETQEKSIEIAETGKWNVFFKGKYKNGKYSFISNKEEVLIDNISPIIDSITKSVTANSFNINVKARDKDSGIKNYYYKIGNKEYVEVKNNFVIKNLEENTEYTITIKVFDNALNSYEVTFTERTSNFNNGVSNSEDNNDNSNTENTTNKSEIDNPNYNNGTTVYPDSNPDKTKPTGNLDEENNTTKPIKTTTTSSGDKSTTTKPVSSTEQTITVKPTNTTKPIKPELEIPKIDLIDLPAVFEYGEKYQLPSHVEFGPSGGNYSCALDHDWSKNVSSTEDFAVGEYTVSCKAISNTGTYAEVSKDIKVIVPNGEDEEWDGWIRLNIYYPVGSTNREWRLHREGEIRGEDDDWESYTGPILVKVSDIGNIYIRYDLDGEKVIDVPNGKVLVDISADKMTLSGEEITNVKITYDKNAKTKEYRINGGNWIQYEKEFSVGADTLIEARATKEENVYDAEGNVIMQKTLVGEDALYISEKGESSLNFGSVRIDINPDKEYLNEKTNVSIDYEDDAIVRMYKVDDSAWLDYTGSFVVSANSTVYAYAESERTIDLDNGVKRTGKAVGRSQKTIFKSGEGNPEGGDNPDENYLHVNINSSHNRLLKGQKATISIVSNEANSKIYYSLDNKNYTLYTNSFEVSANTFIYAKAEYKGKYAYDVKYIEAVSLSDRLEGPVISVSPTTLTEKVTVDIKTKEEAKNIYYSVDGGSYQEYVNTFEVLKNSIIRSYYINKNDKKSEVTYYYVQNIKQPNKPYVKIDASPSIYLNEDIDSVIVTISGSDYDTLEYSFNGIEYFRYERPIQINQSKSIYAKGTNKNGITIEKLNITTSIAPIPLEKLDVAITLSPEENEVQGLIDKLEVSILYDERATGRYYRIGNGDLREYNGPFEINENTTVYAYALNTKGLGETSKQVNYLTTGISNPLIRINPTTPSPWVRVEIEYANTASIKKYKLDDGEWLDYFGPIELITNNTRISAYNEDSLGHYGESEILVDNIIPKDNLTILDNGMYYLIKLNYPTMSNPSDREYKWKKDGEWKKYNPHGIVLIRPEYKDKVIGSDGVKIKDENGKEIIIKDDYYVLDVPLSELSENIFMRWDLAKPNTPTFILSTEEWTKEVTVAINYDKVSVEKLYKIIYSDGEETDWLDYKNPIKISKEDATIYAKSINDVEIQSEIASKRITNIDVIKPEIIDVNILEKGSSNFTIEVLAEDQSSKVDTYMYSLDGEEYITSKNNVYTFNKLKNNKEYQVYIKVTDKAGNISDAYQLSVTTTDIGDISYILDNEGWATEKELTISYPRDVYNGYSYQYSLDLGESWELYEQPLKITENNTIVVARVVDGDNIKVAASFTVSKIDKTIPTISLDGLPSIFSKDLEYVIPTSYTDGISGSNRVCKVPNSDVEYTNSSSLPVGEYTLTCEITTGAGLTAQVSKDIKVTNITVKGNSILDIIETKDLKSGYYDFEVLGTSVIYPVHMYVIEGDQRWSSDQIFGDAGDVATKNDNARNMVVVKVKGNVTIEEGVTVRPYYDELYGGPKGFTMYVTGKLENNGTIDNSHGAKAEGQDVYLWKNADGTYEYVPALGAEGGSSETTSKTKGMDGIGRQTGGGGAGGTASLNTSQGGKGTSYSGGSGGSYKANPPASDIGGQGGGGYQGWGGGAGNPGGGTPGQDKIRYGSNGTGGLLVLYANEYQNNGKLTANGARGGYGTSGGGGSGGGSINIFTNQNTGIDQLGVITNTRYNEILGISKTIGGPEYDNMCPYGDCSAGDGTINIGEVRNGTYYDLKEIIEQDKEAYKNSVTKTGDSILSIINEDIRSGYWFFKVNNEEYPVHMYVIEGDQRWSSDQIFGDAGDVATKNDNARNMVVVKVKGNVTIEEGVTVRPYYDELYGGPKGFTMYVTGKLENNGTIDNSHGAKAEGQDVYLWKNADGTYEYVPALGAEGGSSETTSKTKGMDGIGRQTGGGGAGGTASLNTSQGGKGTSYSGGSGGSYKANPPASDIGGQGGGGYQGWGGGAGNPGGGTPGQDKIRYGSNGTGGLLVLYANEYQNNGKLTANGARGGYGTSGGGGSGGGSINIFTNQNTGIDQLGVITNTRYNEILGISKTIGGPEYDNMCPYGDCSAGDGTINIGEVRNGTYYDLKEIIEQDKEAYKNSVTKTGDSILSIINEDIRSGYWFFKVNNEEYPVHMYVIEGDQRWSSDQIFGDAGDVATKNDNARNMVVVKVKGNVTIEEGVTVRPYYDELYGGPKGFTMYVTGKLENNGTIDNSHGAKAEGQDVYLWKNADGTYEYVPALGAEGGSSETTSKTKGMDGIGRQTGGGGAGGTASLNTSQGGKGTSYSGGSGGSYKANPPASDIGGQGGGGYQGWGGGAGNPGGGTPGQDKIRYGSNGTGGLLVLYANEYQNNGKLTANGARGGYGTSGGGGSGGGSINIFTNQNTGIDQLGVITNTRYNEILGISKTIGGPEYDNMCPYGDCSAGDGTINIGEVRNGTYYDLKEIIEQDKEAYKNSVTKTGDSILSIINEDIRSGYWFFKVNNEEYPVHMYVIEGDQRWSSDQIFGDAGDVATKNDNARNMVVVKVKGNVTIEEGVTVRPYYDELYGGPKGFTMYVTGKLENNGTIDNSHGAKAEGQDVYLWKNADGTYEYVPALGAEGGSSETTSKTKGMDGIGRQTGGGGAGGTASLNTSQGGKGTSYSGGSGGSYKANPPASDIGGQGGGGYQGWGGGAGNPGGGTPGQDKIRYGSNGTGGLLVLYANEYKNNGKLTANGARGGYGTSGGGGSGGGSINIFTNQNTGIDQLGVISVKGGSEYENACVYGDCSAGNGTVTVTQIALQPTSMGYSELIDVNTVQAPKFHMDSFELSSTKEITIDYPSGFINEYSLDLGQTWILYKEPIKIDKNLTIIARTRSSDNILSVASLTVTKIISEKESSILEFYQGDDYLIPTECLIDDRYYKNIKDLETGSYKLVCGSESKQIIIKKKEEITSMEVD